VPARRAGRALSIVFVEDNPDIAQPLALTLERAGHQVIRFADGPSALSEAVSLKPDVVLLDIGLPGMDGYELAAKMKTMPNLRSALFIGISGFKRRAERSGEDFDQYFVKPVDRAKLLTLLDTRAREGVAHIDTASEATQGHKPFRVLLVEDNTDLATAMEGLLRREGTEVRTAPSGQEALDVAPAFEPHLTLCDMSLPDMGGLEVIRKLRSAPEALETHAVMVTAHSEREIRAYNQEAKAIGVEEFISKPVTAEVVRRLIGKLR
jgi:CheY-like chemotaxis protein